MKENNGEIISSQYGPFIVVDVKLIYDSDYNKVETPRVVSICRCGLSLSKPFCDGSHHNAGYVCQKSKDRVKDQVKDYVGKDITIHDNRGVCSHDGSCIRFLPQVFQKNERPWINPDGASVGEIIEVIEKCPSGALSFTLNKKRYQEWGQEEQEIIFEKDGPIIVKGGIELKDYNNCTPECKEHYTLCRCGNSKNMPFCDGSHRE